MIAPFRAEDDLRISIRFLSLCRMSVALADSQIGRRQWNKQNQQFINTNAKPD